MKLRVGEGRGIFQCPRREREECEREQAHLAEGSSLSLNFSMFASAPGARAMHEADGRANSEWQFEI